MDIKNITFIKSAASVDGVSADLPEVAIVGRSNVGKSSFINMLARNKKLAKTSQTPGRTRLINLFNVDNIFTLVDLPGYGYARATTDEINKWAKMINGYVESEHMSACVMLVDVRHEPTEKDKQMLEWLYSYNVPVIIIATKLDKIKKSERAKCAMLIAKTLKVGAADVILTSAETSEGRREAIEKIFSVLNLKNE